MQKDLYWDYKVVIQSENALTANQTFYCSFWNILLLWEYSQNVTAILIMFPLAAGFVLEQEKTVC